MSINAKQSLTGRLGSGSLVGRLGVGTRVEVPDTYVLVDENGNELVAFLTDEEVKLTASEKTDIRTGTTAITDKGIVTGEKEIPAYNTLEGYKLIPNGSSFVLHIQHYDYTKLQAILCPFNINESKSVGAEKVVINDNVYPVRSTEAESIISKHANPNRVDFGITNSSGAPWIIRYFTYKEIY